MNGPRGDPPPASRRHRRLARPSVFGAMDGLVSNFALIAGVAGGTGQHQGHRRWPAWPGSRRARSPWPAASTSRWPASASSPRPRSPSRPRARPPPRSRAGGAGPGLHRAGASSPRWRPRSPGRSPATPSRPWRSTPRTSSASTPRTCPRPSWRPCSSFLVFSVGAVAAAAAVPVRRRQPLGLRRGLLRGAVQRRRHGLHGDRAELVVFRDPPARGGRGGGRAHVRARQRDRGVRTVSGTRPRKRRRTPPSDWELPLLTHWGFAAEAAAAHRHHRHGRAASSRAPSRWSPSSARSAPTPPSAGPAPPPSSSPARRCRRTSRGGPRPSCSRRSRTGPRTPSRSPPRRSSARRPSPARRSSPCGSPAESSTPTAPPPCGARS